MNQPVRPADIKEVAAGAAEATIGHNRPPAFDVDAYQKMFSDVLAYANAAGEWLDIREVSTEEQASYLTDFVAGARKKKKEVDDARKEAKKPHDDAGKAVQAAFAKPIGTLDISIKKALGLLDPYLAKKRREAEEEQRKKAEAARKAAEEAAAAAAAAEARNDIAGQVEAEEAAKAAAKLEKEAAREVKVNVGSATGAGRTIASVTVRSAEITNIRALFMHYQNRPEVAEVLVRLANADIRAKDVDESAIPGIRIVEDSRAR